MQDRFVAGIVAHSGEGIQGTVTRDKVRCHSVVLATLCTPILIVQACRLDSWLIAGMRIGIFVLPPEVIFWFRRRYGAKKLIPWLTLPSLVSINVATFLVAGGLPTIADQTGCSVDADLQLDGFT